MRKDMFELIIERPRYGSQAGEGKGRRSARARRDPESAPQKEPMWHRGNTKCLNENFAPLVRFLKQRVGRPFDAIWSELRAHLSPNSAVQKHVFDHVNQFVERNPIIVDGVAHYPAGCGPKRDQFFPIRARYGFYVCPRTGLFHSVADDERRRRKRKA
jgi:hypothetical protein